jgi:hypothetical protein
MLRSSAAATAVAYSLLQSDYHHAKLTANLLTMQVQEAFRVIDPFNTGYAEIEIIKDIFQKLGFESLSAEDIRVLIETADIDKDNRISLEDFRRMLYKNSKQQVASSVATTAADASIPNSARSGS